MQILLLLPSFIYLCVYCNLLYFQLCVPPANLYLAMQNTQTRNQNAKVEQRIVLMSCGEPPASQRKGLQQFKYHIFVLQTKNIVFLSVFSLQYNMIIQQPFQKVAKTERNPHIKIQPPYSLINLQKRYRINTDHHKIDKVDILKSQIKEVKTRVVDSKLALMLSRKQQTSPSKIVNSDHLGIVFDHEGSKKTTEKIKINLSKVYQRDDETQRQQDVQGDIQIPLHLTSSFEQKNFRSIPNDIQHFESSRYDTPQDQKWNSSRQQQKNYTQRRATIKPLRRQLFNLNDYKPKELVNGSQRDRNIHLLRQRQLQKMNRSLQNLTKNNTLEKYFLNQSLQKLPKYSNNERKSTSKGKIILPFKKPEQKIKIKLNKPTCGKSASGKQLLRPRYQFQIPTIKINQQEVENHKKLQIDEKSDWDELKKQVNKYEFVRKYLTETEIFAIYEHLKKNKIRQQKWPLFVVDEASKKMKLSSFK